MKISIPTSIIRRSPSERSGRWLRSSGCATRRGGLGLVYAPHVTAGPEQIVELVLAVLEAGASGVMFSETYAGGTVRMVREATARLKNPPAIYGHNAGIGVKTRSIWREVIDFLARLDGIDFRQTAPCGPGRRSSDRMALNGMRRKTALTRAGSPASTPP